jgi:hypothetical protein
MGVLVSLKNSLTEHSKSKQMFLQIENGDRWREILWNVDSIPIVENCAINLPTKLIFRMEITCFSDKQHNEALWPKMNISSNWKQWYVKSNHSKSTLKSQKGTIQGIQHSTKLVLEQEFHVSLKYNIIENSETTWMFLQIEISDW